MLDAIARFAHRHPRVVCYGINGLLPALCVLSVPTSYLVLQGNDLDTYNAAGNFATFLLWMTPVQIGPAALSFGLSFYLLPTFAERGLNLFCGLCSVPLVFVCSFAIVIRYLH